MAKVSAIKAFFNEIAPFYMKLDFDMVAPKQQMGFTKLTSAAFRKLTHYDGTTSEHARDAAMLVFNGNRMRPLKHGPVL